MGCPAASSNLEASAPRSKAVSRTPAERPMATSRSECGPAVPRALDPKTSAYATCGSS